MCLPLHADGVKPKALAPTLQCEDDRQPVTGNFRGQGWDSLYRGVFVTEECKEGVNGYERLYRL